MTMEKPQKKQKLRNAEYFDLQETMDSLYAKSKENYKFTSLMELVTSNENILLAYRNISKNKGSKTAGTDGKTIRYLSGFTDEALVMYVRKRLDHYQPQPVRRVEIPKGDTGKTRPLGIPTIADRLIQQCFLQILEPICEAKFHERSNGFRPNRSAEHALAQCYAMIQKRDLHYVIDIDIKGFFDNVNHGKLLKQMWSMGIRDASVELSSNRLALYCAQHGCCAVTNLPLEIGDIHCHHKKPRSQGGNDRYSNLILVSEAVHVLIHATSSEVIAYHMRTLNLNTKQKTKLNSLRKAVGLSSI